MNVRGAEPEELDQLAALWNDGWQDAHARILPPELARFRTLASFRTRIEAYLPNVRVAGPLGRPLGFHIVKGDELYQLYVAAQARGTGVATALIADAEAMMRKNGMATGWLACAIGNERAARFYERSGWHRAGNMISQSETPDGLFALEVWRYEKPLIAT